MESYRLNGAQLGCQLLPAQQAVEIWRSDSASSPDRLLQATKHDAGDLFSGLHIELAEVWRGRGPAGSACSHWTSSWPTGSH